MSSAPSPSEPPGDDFVLWPDGVKGGMGKVDEGKIRGALEMLAPPDPVSESEGGEGGPSVMGEAAGSAEAGRQDDRFYPASRHWFRTTAAIPTVNAAEKWWQETAPPAAETAEGAIGVDGPGAPRLAPLPRRSPSDEGAHMPTPGLLSPEQVWELAAEELEQAGRLRGRLPEPQSELVPERLPDLLPVVESGRPAEVAPVLEVVAPEEAVAEVLAPEAEVAALEKGGVGVSRPEARSTEPVVLQPPIARRLESRAEPLPSDGPSMVGQLSEPAGDTGAAGEGGGDTLPRRDRRPAAERRRRSSSARSGRRWGRRVLAVLGLLVMLLVVAAVVGRDLLPTDWGGAARHWWRTADEIIFPHQYGRPQRGVQHRASDARAGSEPGAAASIPELESSAAEPGRPDEGPPPSTAHESVSPDPVEAIAAPEPSSDEQPAADSEAEPIVPTTELFPPMPEFIPRAEPVYDDPEDEVPPSAEIEPALIPIPSEATAAAADMTISPSPPTEQDVSEEGDRLATGDDAVTSDDAPEVEVGVTTNLGNDPSHVPIFSSAEITEAQAVVRRLLAARSVEDVLPLVFDARSLEPTIRSYHARSPLVPLTESVIEHDSSGIIPATGGRAHIFNVLDHSHPRGFPVSAESTPQGFLIDWPSYIQWRDGWLSQFVRTKPTDPQSLFVVLRRTHYFNDDVPDLDNKYAFKVTSAVDGDEGTVAFVDKNSAIGRSLAEHYEWRRVYYPVVELQWVRPGKEGEFLRLNRIVRPTWRRVGE